jgi:hypothetical protein
MEQPLVVLVDPEQRIVYLYGEQNRQFKFDEMFALRPFLEGRNVMYVVQAEECESEVVLDQVEAMWQEILETDEEVEAEPKYIRINKEGYTWIPELKIKFSGPKDAKPVKQVGEDIFLRSPTMRKLLIANQVDIMGETAAKALRKPRPGPRNRDAELDKMILNRKEDVLDNDEMFNGENDIDEKDATETDEDIAIKRLGFGR